MVCGSARAPCAVMDGRELFQPAWSWDMGEARGGRSGSPSPVKLAQCIAPHPLPFAVTKWSQAMMLL